MISRLFILLFMLVAIQGCRQEDKNPENSDPIYLDLQKDTRGLESEVEDLKKKLEAAEKEFLKTAPRTLERKNAERDLEKQREKLIRAEQMTEFLKIRTERRRVEGRRAYKIAFKNGESWPDPKEIEAYKINKKLLYSSKNWNDRVPKTKHNQMPGENSSEAKSEHESGDASEAPTAH